MSPTFTSPTFMSPTFMSPVRRVAALAVLVVCVGVVLGACGSDSSSSRPRWSQLRSVRVTVARPGLPPPGGLPYTSTFTTPEELDRVTDALNAHDIAKGATRPRDGCTGGQEVTIVIVSAKPGTARVVIHAYLCAGRQFDDARGDVAGFLEAAGVSRQEGRADRG